MLNVAFGNVARNFLEHLSRQTFTTGDLKHNTNKLSNRVQRSPNLHIKKEEMTEAAAMFSRLLGSHSASSQEEKMMVDLLFDNNVTLRMGDTRLNNITALTWNLNQSQKVFRSVLQPSFSLFFSWMFFCSFLTKSLDPEKYPWQTLHKSLLLLHTIILYGSEAAIDSCIQMFRAVDKLTSYNSALVKQRGLFSAGGTDYGAPVREEARIVCEILVNDDNIREARRSAHESADSLVPMGEDFAAKAAASQGKSNAATMGFGQGMDSQYLGAGFDLSQVPGMYENRPDRYFDDKNDPRAQATAGDHQFTREVIFLSFCSAIN